MENDSPTLMDAAGRMALPIGILWSSSFLCAMYGTERPLLSMMSTALGIISIYALYRQLTNYRKIYPSVSWLHILRLSFVTCLLAGLLTDAAQYLYFVFLDGGRLLSVMGNAMQMEEYREAWQRMLPGTSLDEVEEMIQTMTVRDIMLEMIIFNVLLALPISLIAAIASPKPSKVNGEKSK